MAGFPGSVLVCATPDHLAEVAANWLVHVMRSAYVDHGRVTLALSGGSTPERLFRTLAAPAWRARLPWAVTHVYWCDERAVPPDDAASNYGRAKQQLLDHVELPAAQIHRMPADDPDLDAATARYAGALPARFDLLLLGIGEDGHTASLFPGSPLLKESRRRVAAVTDAPKPPPCRLTLTPPVIESAGHLLVLASGAGKAEAIARALKHATPVVDCPARLARRGTWLLDRAAARAILDPHGNLLNI